MIFFFNMRRKIFNRQIRDGKEVWEEERLICPFSLDFILGEVKGRGKGSLIMETIVFEGTRNSDLW